VRIGVALVAGLLLIAVAIVASLSHAPLIVAAENSQLTHRAIATTTTAAGACQKNETVPSDTSAIRLGLDAVAGPEVTVSVYSGPRLLTRGTHAAGWEGGAVAIPVHPLTATFKSVTVCFQLHQLNGPVEMIGMRTSRYSAIGQEGKRLPGRLHIEYLRPSPRTWWSMILPTARRLGLGRPAGGTWNALLVLALAATVAALSFWLIARELR
jgi:hypothetical protein